jgi:hypothetical protein
MERMRMLIDSTNFLSEWRSPAHRHHRAKRRSKLRKKTIPSPQRASRSLQMLQTRFRRWMEAPRDLGSPFLPQLRLTRLPDPRERMMLLKMPRPPTMKSTKRMTKTRLLEMQILQRLLKMLTREQFLLRLLRRDDSQLRL